MFISLFLVVAVLYFSEMITVRVFNVKSFGRTRMLETSYVRFQNSKEYLPYIRCSCSS